MPIIAAGWLWWLVGLANNTAEAFSFCGCGASLNSYSRRARSSEGSVDGYKVFALADSD